MGLNRQILCVWLPYFPIARRYRRRFDWQTGRAAVAAEIARVSRVVAASPAAVREGVRYGMNLAEARVLCSGLECAAHDPAGDRRALEALGRWMTRFTPVVATGWEAAEGEELPHVLFLDVTGCARLFGGIGNIIERVRAALRGFRIPAKLAVAPTVGGAWAVASCGRVRGRVVDEGELRETLSELPLRALRLSKEVRRALRRLGFRTAGELLALPREQLPARFGAELLTRIDQATGDRPELLVPLAYVPAIGARVEFDFSVESQEAIRIIFEGLLDRVLVDLVRRGVGARRVDLICVPDRSTGESSVIKTIALARACRDRKTLLILIRSGVEQLACEQGFVAFRLNLPAYERIGDGDQATAFGQREEAGTVEAERLMDRLRLRLGEHAVIRPGLVESYLPERAWRDGAEGTTVLAGVVRPLCLLPTLVEIRVVCEPSDDRMGSPWQFTERAEVHRLVHAVGPERITGEWWGGQEKVRDYYDVEDEVGQRFWIFRAALTTPTRWFLHGLFQ